MSTTTRRRRAWTIPEWAAFTRRCALLRDRVWAYTVNFPRTDGFGAPQMDAIINVRYKIIAAMIRLEALIIEQHGDNHSAAFNDMHATFEPAGHQGPRVRGTLSRAQWAELGQTFKPLRDEAMALLIELQYTAGKNSTYMRKFAAVGKAFDQAKCKLDSLVCKQHPDWYDFSHVFYGPTPPRLDV